MISESKKTLFRFAILLIIGSVTIKAEDIINPSSVPNDQDTLNTSLSTTEATTSTQESVKISTLNQETTKYSTSTQKSWAFFDYKGEQMFFSLVSQLYSYDVHNIFNRHRSLQET